MTMVKKLNGIESRMIPDKSGGLYKNSLRLWLRDRERWYPILRKTI